MHGQQQQHSAAVHAQVLRSVESAMANANPFEFGPHTGQQWQNKLSTAERAIDPWLERIMPELRSRIQPQNGIGDGDMIVEELHRYRHFLSRKQIKAKLQGERQALIGRLTALLIAQRREIERLQNSTNIPTGRFLTEIAAKIVWLRNNSLRIGKLRKAAATFFDDLPDYAPFEQSLRTLAEELKMAEQEQFDAWCRDMIAHVDDQNGDSISLQTTGRLMVLERDKGVLNVSYSDRLARLLREGM